MRSRSRRACAGLVGALLCGDARGGPQALAPHNNAEAVAAQVSGWSSVAAFGARGDGSTDDTQAIQAAIRSGRPALLPPGTYKTTASLDIRGGTALIGLGGGQARIRAFHAGPAIVMSGARAVLKGIDVEVSPEFRGRYTGVKIEGGAAPSASTHNIIEDVRVFDAGTAFWLSGGVYFSHFRSILAHRFHDNGILLDAGTAGLSGPNNNVFLLDALEGTDEKATWDQCAIKIVRGTVNTFIGGEPAPAKYSVWLGEGTYGNRFIGLYGEHTQFVLRAGKGSLNFWDSHAWIQDVQLDDDAKIIGPSGLDLSFSNNWLQRTIRGDRSLRGLYLFNEGEGSIVLDHSGRGQHLNIISKGQPIWNEEGRWGKGLRLQPAGGTHVQDLPPGLLDWKQPFTVAILMRRESDWNVPTQFSFRNTRTGRYLRLNRAAGYAQADDWNGLDHQIQAGTTMKDSSQDAWSWTIYYVDPPAHRVVLLDPFFGLQELAVRFSAWDSSGASAVNSVSFMQHPGAAGIRGVVSFLAFWQRRLTWGEVLDLVNMKVPLLSPVERAFDTRKRVELVSPGGHAYDLSVGDDGKLVITPR